jgi:hypothetical protein
MVTIMRTSFSLTLGAALLLFACIGCSKRTPDFKFKLEAPGSGIFMQYKLVVDGSATNPLPSDQPYEFTVHAHDGATPKEMLPHLEASVLFVCGWQPANVGINMPTQDAIEQARKEKRSVPVIIYLDFERPTWQDVAVLVDNRDGPAGRLSVGEFEQPLAAGEARKFFFPYWPHCDQARQLRLNAEIIGNIEEDPNSPGTALPLLLDTSASRCYRYEWKTYGSSPGFGGSGTKTYSAQRLRVLSSSVDYFLLPLQSVEYSTQSVVQKSSLNEISCKEVK